MPKREQKKAPNEQESAAISVQQQRPRFKSKEPMKETSAFSIFDAASSIDIEKAKAMNLDAIAQRAAQQMQSVQHSKRETSLQSPQQQTPDQATKKTGGCGSDCSGDCSTCKGNNQQKEIVLNLKPLLDVVYINIMVGELREKAGVNTTARTDNTVSQLVNVSQAEQSNALSTTNKDSTSQTNLETKMEASATLEKPQNDPVPSSNIGAADITFSNIVQDDPKPDIKEPGVIQQSSVSKAEEREKTITDNASNSQDNKIYSAQIEKEDKRTGQSKLQSEQTLSTPASKIVSESAQPYLGQQSSTSLTQEVINLITKNKRSLQWARTKSHSKNADSNSEKKSPDAWKGRTRQKEFTKKPKKVERMVQGINRKIDLLRQKLKKIIDNLRIKGVTDKIRNKQKLFEKQFKEIKSALRKMENQLMDKLKKLKETLKKLNRREKIKRLQLTNKIKKIEELRRILKLLRKKRIIKALLMNKKNTKDKRLIRRLLGFIKEIIKK